MPRVKLGSTPRDRLGELIRGSMAMQGRNAADAGVVMGCCTSTALKRIRNPQDMTIRQLMAVTKWLRLPIDEVRPLIG